MPTGIHRHKSQQGFQKGHLVSRELRIKLSETHKGKPSNRLGKHCTETTKEKMRKSHLGHITSNETREKQRNANKGRIVSDETRNKLRECTINHTNRIFKDTKIELKIEQELIKRGINYQKQVPLCKIARVDFYLPEYRIVIQADGDYWHNLQDHIKRDTRQDAVLTFNGFNVYRFWEHEINESVENCIDKIILK